MAIKILEPFLMLGFLIAAGLFFTAKILDLDSLPPAEQCGGEGHFSHHALCGV